MFDMVRKNFQRYAFLRAAILHYRWSGYCNQSDCGLSLYRLSDHRIFCTTRVG